MGLAPNRIGSAPFVKFLTVLSAVAAGPFFWCYLRQALSFLRS
jgi:hypothetical protein